MQIRQVFPTFAAALAITCLPANRVTAQLTLDRFFPPVVTAGESVQIKADGKFPQWPAQADCGDNTIQITPEKESGTLSVKIPVDHSAGAVWIRMHDAVSASAATPLLVTSLPTIAETEPNNAVPTSPLDIPIVTYGRLAKSGDIDSYRVKLQSGQTLVASLTAHQVLASPMDAVLQLTDPAGNVIQHADDVRGIDPQLTYTSDRDQDVVVRLFAFPEVANSTVGYAGSSSFVYALTLTNGPFIDHALPLVASATDPPDSDRLNGINLPTSLNAEREVSPLANTITSPHAAGWQWTKMWPQPVQHFFDYDDANTTDDEPSPLATELPAALSGHISAAREIDRIRFNVVAGKRYRAEVRSREFGFHFDSVLRLVNTADPTVQLARNDDRRSKEYDALLNYSAKADGIVELQVSDLYHSHGPRHAYTVVIYEPKPTVTLDLAADQFVFPDDDATANELEITVEIKRLDGFDASLSINAADLPEGITATAITSEPKGATAKTVKLKLVRTKDLAFAGPIKIVAHTVDSEGKPTGVPIHAAHQLRPNLRTDQIWITAAAAP